MNLFKVKVVFIAIFAMVSTCAFAQKQTKTIKKSFKVNPEVTIEIDSKHTDVVFETWDKNSVEVEAIFEIEGISEDEAQKYFKKINFSADGGNDKVIISNQSVFVFPEIAGDFDFQWDFPQEFEFDFPELDSLQLLGPLPFIATVPEIPPMPPAFLSNRLAAPFDYEAYKKDGDKYLEKWKKEWNKNFDENVRTELENWKKEMEKFKVEMEKNKEQWKLQREKMKVQIEKSREQALQAREQSKQAREQAKEARNQMLLSFKNDSTAPNVFFLKSNGKTNTIRVKQTLKIKMPKGAKLDLKIQHGSVKLAANTKNIRANLSHAKLTGLTIDGALTDVVSAFSPIHIENWNSGKLNVKFSDQVNLNAVKHLNLSFDSSNIDIGSISGKAVLYSNFGNLQIGDLLPSFTLLEIHSDNTDVNLKLPKVSYSFQVSNRDAVKSFPKTWKITGSKGQKPTFAKGYNISENPAKKVVLNSNYGKFTVKE